LLACVVAAALTYYLARGALVEQRTSEARQRAITNAIRVREEIRSGRELGEYVSDHLTREPGGFLLVITLGDGNHYPNGPLQLANPEALPASLRAAVDGGIAASQRFSIEGTQYIAVGVPMPDVNSVYYEAVSLSSTAATLR